MAPTGSWQRAALVDIRATLLAGIWLGVLIGGIGGRLAMLLLRVLSPDHVRGVTSDDGFLIGQVTLSGTYDLLLVGGAFGIVGAVGYRLVDRWLIGPGWFRRLTAALGAGAVIGSMLVHTDGVDFVLLDPLWLAIALFVLIPALFGFFIGPLEAALARPDSWVHRGWRAWALPAVTLLVFPFFILMGAFVAGAMLVARGIRQVLPVDSISDNAVVGLLVRGAWLGIAVLGAVSLVSDARTILA